MKQDLLIKCVEIQLGRTGVKLDDRFLEDLGAESMDMVHLAAMLEEQTGLFLPVESFPALDTVRDLYNHILSLE